MSALAAQIMDVAGRYFLPASLWAVMLAMGMGLSVADFRGIVSNRRAFLVGVGSMLVLVPACGIALGTAFAPTPVLAVGLILLATTPSGILSNLLTDIAGGEVALSISISLLLSLVYVFTLPFIAHFALEHALGESASIAIPLADSMGHILTITLIPVLLGMFLRAFRPAIAAVAAPIIKRAATTLLVVLFGMIIVQQMDTLRSAFGPLLAIVLAMNVVNAVIAQIVSSVARVRRAERIAISVEHLIRQEATAIYVAVSLLHRNDMSLPMILNTFVGMAFCVTFVAVMRRRRAQASRAAPSKA
jgi:BASS family bile acid:Na+ symporter